MNELSELIKRYKDFLCDPDMEYLYQGLQFDTPPQVLNRPKYPDLDITQIAWAASKRDWCPIYILNHESDDEKHLINSESLESNYEYNLMLLNNAEQGTLLHVVYYNIVKTEEIYCKIDDCFKLFGGSNLWYILK